MRVRGGADSMTRPPLVPPLVSHHEAGNLEK